MGQEDKSKKPDKSNVSTESDKNDNFEVTELIAELEKMYPLVPRGVIYEATMCISDENFLQSYLKEKQIQNSPSNRELTIGDLFQAGDTKELNTVINLGKKSGMSKPVIIGAAALLTMAKTVYQVFANEDIKKELDEIDVAHSKKLLDKARALTEKVGTEEQSKKDNK